MYTTHHWPRSPQALGATPIQSMTPSTPTPIQTPKNKTTPPNNHQLDHPPHEKRCPIRHSHLSSVATCRPAPTGASQFYLEFLQTLPVPPHLLLFKSCLKKSQGGRGRCRKRLSIHTRSGLMSLLALCRGNSLRFRRMSWGGKGDRVVSQAETVRRNNSNEVQSCGTETAMGLMSVYGVCDTWGIRDIL